MREKRLMRGMERQNALIELFAQPAKVRWDEQ
jgi:hypothetical protein